MNTNTKSLYLRFYDHDRTREKRSLPKSLQIHPNYEMPIETTSVKQDQQSTDNNSQ